MLYRFNIIVLLVLFIACSETPAVEISGFETTKYSDSEIVADNMFSPNFLDCSANEVLSKVVNDKILMNFYPENYFSQILLPGKTCFQVSDENSDKNQMLIYNPVIAEINEVKIDAVKFADRMFQRHRDWFEYFLKELFVDTAAKFEATKEGIHFSKRYIKDANRRIIKLLKGRAQKEGKYFSKIWADQGFETEKAYVQAWEKITARMLLLEHLIFLMYFRTDKVEYSHIVISDREDKFNPDPLGKAKELAQRIRKGKISWKQAVKQYSQDHKTAQKDGKVGLLLRESSGQPALEDFLFSNKAGSISEPLQTIYGFEIVRIDKQLPGKPDATYKELLDDIDSELNRVFKTHIPGLRITNQDTFDWLEKLLRKKMVSIFSFYPSKPEEKPFIGIVNDKKISAGEFFVHTFSSKPEWARQVMSEILIFELAKIEAKKENIQLTTENIDKSTKAVLKYLKNQTENDEGIEVEEDAGNAKDKNNETENKENNVSEEMKIWKKLNYPTEAEFNKVVKMLTVEALQIERLILLHDYRLERIKLYHILCISEEVAIELRAKIFVTKDFEGVARRFSKHKKTRERGGLLGIVPKGTYSKAYEDVAFKLRVNEISKPFETEQGWHILKVTQKFPAKPDAKFSELNKGIETELSQRGSVPGKRITTGDMFRWVSRIIASKRYEIKTYIPNIEKFKPEAPKEEEAEND